jgi:hypothetical protein
MELNNGMCFFRRSQRPILQQIVDHWTVPSICRLLNDNETSSDPELPRESTFYSEYVIPGASSRGLDSGIMMALIASEAPPSSSTAHSSQIRMYYRIF